MRPEVAEALVGREIDWAGIVQAGVAVALTRARWR
jgi:hypothetical protein